SESFLQMSQSLLERNTGNVIQPGGFMLFLESSQTLCGTFIIQALTALVVSISTLAQRPVVDVAAAAEGLRQDSLLLIGWIKPILVGTLLVHILHDSIYCVECQVVLSPRPLKGDGYSRTAFIDCAGRHVN